MCNLCQRLETLKAIDSKPLKPLIIILSILYERLEPTLGDSFLRREARIHSIRKRLVTIQKGPLKGLIGAIISDLDSELAKLEISKVDHPALNSVGKLDSLKGNVRPEDSASVRVRKGKGNRERGDKEREEKKAVWLDLSRYEVVPHPDVIEWSTKVVDEWLRKNDGDLLSEGVRGD